MDTYHHLILEERYEQQQEELLVHTKIGIGLIQEKVNKNKPPYSKLEIGNYIMHYSELEEGTLDDMMKYSSKEPSVGKNTLVLHGNNLIVGGKVISVDKLTEEAFNERKKEFFVKRVYM